LTIVDSKEFINEVRLLTKLKHPCCTRLIGCTIAPQHMIIMDLYPTNLNKLLIENTVELYVQKSLSLDVISGLSYLHSCSIIHRDLKTSNILITENIRACITDFGVSKSMTSLANSSLRLVGTPIYIAPEICAQLSAYTIQSDYYALGIILWEIFENNSLPYFQEYPQIYTSKYPVLEMTHIHQRRLRPVFEEIKKNIELKELKQQIEKLWNEDPQQRPSELTTLKQIIERITTK